MTAPVTTAATAATAERMSTLDAEFFFAEHGNVPLPIKRAASSSAQVTDGAAAVVC
jgi:hypothetical protein